MRVALLISGSGSNAEALIRSMVGDHPARPVGVISNVAGVAGLGRAEALGVPASVVESRRRPRAEFEAELAEALAALKPDLTCLAGFMRILSGPLVERFAMLNIHPSLLPLYPGLDTHARALANGDAEAGCTVHRVTADLDAGPILGQARVPILDGDGPDDLAKRVQKAEHRLYPAVLRRVAEGDMRRLDLPALA